MPMISEVRAPKSRRESRSRPSRSVPSQKCALGRQRRAFERQPVEELLVRVDRARSHGARIAPATTIAMIGEPEHRQRPLQAAA